MDNFNKVISFVLGLVVVLVFVAVISGKINLRGKNNTTESVKTPGTLFGFGVKTSPTPTPAPTSVSKITINDKTTNSYGSYTNSKVTTPQSIPSTGLPSIFVPMMFMGALGGSFLSKVGKK